VTLRMCPKPWARRPNWLQVKIKTLGCHPNWPKGRVSARPLDTRAFLTARCRSLALFQQYLLVPQNPAAARFPSLGLQTALKDTRFSTSRFGVIFESGHKLSNSQPHC